MMKEFMFKEYICVKQHDIQDCGEACLTTIFKTYGRLF
ncbi:MAG: cysteine peptidase family C39 domain-containing protein [Eubacteriaceae bacterium]